MDDVEPLAVRRDELVCEVERAAHAARDVRGKRRRQRTTEHAMTIDELSDGGTLDVLHGDEVVAAHFAELEDLHDVAVHQVRGELRLVDERAEELPALRVARMDHLERDALGESLGAELLGLVHGRHPAFGDLADEAEATGELELWLFHGRSAGMRTVPLMIGRGPAKLQPWNTR